MFNEKIISAVVPAAGLGKRMGGDKKKQFLEINGIPVIVYTLRKLSESPVIDEIIAVTGKDDIDLLKKIVAEYEIKKISAIESGGETRQHSVYNGAKKAKGDYILIHDGVRPFVSFDEIADAVSSAVKYGAAAAGIPLTDTIKLSDKKGFSLKTLPRDNIVRILTPQVLEKKLYFDAYKNAVDDNLETTDDISLAELMGVKPKISLGSIKNIKITRPEDVEIAEKLMG